MTKNKIQRLRDRRRKTEDGGRKSEVGSTKREARSRKPRWNVPLRRIPRGRLEDEQRQRRETFVVWDVICFG
ncbi:MAG: hypothetical protein ACP5D9_14765 [Mariniphaga sp.]